MTTRTGSIGPQLTIDRRRDEDGRLSPLAPVGGFKLDFRGLFADRLLGGSDRGGSQTYAPGGTHLPLGKSQKINKGTTKSLNAGMATLMQTLRKLKSLEIYKLLVRLQPARSSLTAY